MTDTNQAEAVVRHVSRHTMQRLASLFAAAVGQRLTYKELIA